jgi:hypothetical protein
LTENDRSPAVSESNENNAGSARNAVTAGSAGRRRELNEGITTADY